MDGCVAGNPETPSGGPLASCKHRKVGGLSLGGENAKILQEKLF